MSNTENTAKYILQVLRYQPIIVMSWGVPPSSYRLAESDGMGGLQFTTSGFLHKGQVQVLYNEGLDLFEIRLLNDDGSVKLSQEEVYVDELVSTIDNLVEKTENYQESVFKEYGFSQS